MRRRETRRVFSPRPCGAAAPEPAGVFIKSLHFCPSFSRPKGSSGPAGACAGAGIIPKFSGSSCCSEKCPNSLRFGSWFSLMSDYRKTAVSTGANCIGELGYKGKSGLAHILSDSGPNYRACQPPAPQVASELNPVSANPEIGEKEIAGHPSCFLTEKTKEVQQIVILRGQQSKTRLVIHWNLMF